MKHTGFITALVLSALAVTTVSAQAQGPRGLGGISFETLDTNGDGQITAEELQAREQVRFEVADTNKDGTLSRSELEAAAQARVTDRVSAMLVRLDANGDGVLTFEEVSQPGRHDRKSARFDRMFDRADADGSGGLSAEEFAKAQQHMGKRHHSRSDKN